MFATSLFAIRKALSAYKKTVKFLNMKQEVLFFKKDIDLKEIKGYYLSTQKLNKELKKRNLKEIQALQNQLLGTCVFSSLKGSKTYFSKYKAMKIKNFAFYTMDDCNVPFIEIPLDQDTKMFILERKRPKKSSVFEVVKMLELLPKKEVENLDYIILPEIRFKHIEKIEWVNGVMCGLKEINHVYCYSSLTLKARDDIASFRSNYHYTVKTPFFFYIKKRHIKDPILIGYMNQDSWAVNEKGSKFK